MAQTRLGWLVGFLIGSILVAGVVLAFRMSRVESAEHELQVVPAEAGRIYQERMEATRMLMNDGFLEVSDRGGR
ncbi:hypothetical protein JXB37_04375 [candidate division WOR-3 bacterium]|nr:hypothetical protein [candidate division WOR-3 bacterium]